MDRLNAVASGLGIVAVVVGALIAVALAWVTLSGRVQKQTVDQLRELTNALTARVDNLEEEREDLKGRVDTLEQENSVLRSIVTGEVQVIELTALVREHQIEIMRALVDIQRAVTHP